MFLLGSDKVMAVYVTARNNQSSVTIRSRVPTKEAGLREINTSREILRREMKSKRGDDKQVSFSYGAWND